MNKELIHRVFESRIAEYGELLAVQSAEGEVSYGELNEGSNRLGHMLKEEGLKSGEVVGVLLGAGIRLVESLLGILKSGGVYMPLEQSFSAVRVEQMLEETGCRLLLTSQEDWLWLEGRLSSGGLKGIRVLVVPGYGESSLAGAAGADLPLGITVSEDPVSCLYGGGTEGFIKEGERLLSQYSSQDMEEEVSGDSANYIFYTSGSTGKGKGITGRHRSLSHYVHWHAGYTGMCPGMRVSQLAPVSFDASLKDILPALISGSTVCIVPREVRENMELLGRWLADKEITVLQTVPSLFRMLTRAIAGQGTSLPELKRVVLAGERLYGRDVENWRSCGGREVQLSNLYGLTETTILKSYYDIPADREYQGGELVPVGRAISNTVIAVISDGRLCSQGEIGEVYIKSPYMTKGYVKEELNGVMFVQNPLVTDREDIVCRTGDTGRYLSDGNLEILGRRDEQVKVGGVRIELGEVRSALLRVEGIEQVELVVQQEAEGAAAGGGELLCYYTGRERSADQLRERLSAELNRQLLPSYYIWLEEFPLTVNGKVDRKNLPRPEGMLSSVAYEAARDKVEEGLVTIWQEVLGVKGRIGVGDSFFGMGGSSLKAIQLISRVYRAYEVQLTIADIFSTPTLGGQGELIRRSVQVSYEGIKAVADAAHYPLSYAQRRLWLTEQRRGDALPFNGLELFELEGALDVASLTRSFESLVERHESLRTVFEVVEGEPRQRVLELPDSGFKIRREDVRGLADAGGRVEQLCRELVSRPFNLEKELMMRVLLVQRGEDSYTLALSMHHIVSDEWSMQVMVKELVTLYNAYSSGEENPLSPLTIQYRDYAAWQLSELSGERLADHRRYWLEKLEGHLPVVELPSDRSRPSEQTYHGDHYRFTIPGAAGSGLAALCQSQGATLFMGLTALVKALLYRYTGQKDIVIGTPVAGRDHPDLEGQIGYYLNTLALRTQVDSGAGFSSLLLRVKETTVEGFSHQVYPFDRLVEELDIVQNPSRSPLFDVAVILQNIRLHEESELRMEGVRIEPSGTELKISKGDLRFQFVEQSGQSIQAEIEYNTDLFDRTRIEKMRHNFLGLLQEVLSDTEKSLQELSYGEEEPGDRTLFSSEQNREEYEPVHRVFESRIAEYGEMLALQSAEGEVSYGELNEGSNRLGHMLKDMGLKSGEVVGVLLGGGIRLVESLLGILKSGGVYMPLEQSFSAVRVEQMLEETGCRLLLTGAEDWLWLEGRLSSGGLKGIRVLVVPGYGESSLAGAAGADLPLGITVSEDPVSCLYGGGTEGFIKEGERLLSQYSSQDMEEEVSGDSANYIFYTSGSTGKGKGITGRHRSLSHYVHWHAGYTGMRPGMRVSQLAPVSFDASLKDILPALISGSTVCIVPREVRENMELLGRWLADKEITVLQTVPSLFRMVTRAIAGQGTSLPELKRVVLAGERLYGRDVENWRSCGGREVQLSNLYGLTETTILKSYYDIPADREYQGGELVPVGRAISNTVIAVISDGRLCSQGEIGEVYIKSPYMTKGYVKEELNGVMFVQNPLVTDREDIVCRTGDTGRYLSDGNLEILGRRDEQVKVGGVRIELGEVRSALLRVEGIEQVELVVQQEAEGAAAGGGELLCYYTGRERSADQLRERLSAELNRQLLPSYYIWLEEFPLTVNGKVDRKNLPRPEGMLSSVAYEAARDKVEEGLVTIWQEVLGVKGRIGVGDSFFGMGGSSLKAIQLISRVYRAYEVQLTIADIFSTPTLGGQGELIRRSVQVSYEGIKAIPDQAHYPLSYAQRRLWILDKLNDNMTAYSRPIAYTINGELNKKALGEAIFTMIARHEILRTVFREVEGEPRQYILSLEESGFTLEYEDLQKEPDIASALQLSISNLASFTYNFETGPLFRIRLLQTAADKFELLLGIHHIISDEWSMQVMVKELVTLYNAYSSGEENPLPPMNIQYRDYAVWQHNLLEGENAANHKEYWLSKLGGELPVLDFPAKGVRPAVQSFNGEQMPVLFSQKEIDELNILCKSCGATLFMGLTALVKALLYRYTGQNDIITGTPVAGRDHTDLEEQIGFYVNTLALRTKLDGDKGFASLLNEVKRTILEALDHQVYPFDRLVDELDLPRDMSRTPVFDVSVVLQNNQVQAGGSESMGDLDIAQSRVTVTTSLYDITFWFAEQQEGMLLNLEYNNDIYSRERMIKLAEHFKQLFASILENPSKPIGRLEYLNNEERLDILEFSSHNKPRSYSTDTLVSLFESQVIKNPEADALVFGEKKFSFKELNEAANRVAHYLKNECGAGPGEKIGLLMDRSEWLLPGLIGILKSGAAFVPIDPSYPVERIRYIFKDAGITTLVTDNDTYADDYVCIHPGDSKLNQYNENNPTHNISSADLAYVIYTSGSTGRPKGVMIEHSSVVNYLQWANEFYFNNESGYGFAVYTSLSFDLTITSLLSGLYRGDCAWIFADESIDTMLRQIFCHHKLRAVKLTPSHIGLLGKMEVNPEACNITHTIVGGETLTAYHVGVLRQLNPHIRIYNEYGPTEATVGCTVKEVQENLLITIGKPIANTTAYVLNDSGSLQPAGVFGELCIGGAGLARGYLNKEDLTKEKFVTGFFEADRLYRTGDRARWRTDGELEYQGRIDNQVKLRGYRIEPGEIEVMMLDYDGLKESIVVPLQAGSEMLLAGYFTAEDKIDTERFRKYLNNHLPEYMVPAFLYQLAAFPLNANGKVDRDKLPVVINEELEAYQPPANNIEATLAGIYGEVLNKEKVSATGHFFRLGGHSLKAIQVVTRIYKALSVKIELRDIFTYPVIKDLAAFISNANADKYEAIPHIPDSEYYAISYAQRRLWVLDQFEGISIAYNMSERYWLTGPLDVAALEKAFLTLVQRHESLRTVFELFDGEPHQRVMSFHECGFQLLKEDLRSRQFPEQEAAQLCNLFIQEPFVLSKGPLCRVLLAQTASDKHLLSFSIHHIISDEWTMQIILKEVLTLYNAFVSGSVDPLLPLSIQYRDYAAWQNELLKEEKQSAHKAFWLKKLSGLLPVLELATSFHRPPVKTYNGSIVSGSLPDSLVNSLREFCLQKEVTAFMALVSLIKSLLFRYTGQEDIIIGTPVAGRSHPDLDGQLGFYVNTLVIRSNFTGQMTFEDLVKLEKENILDSFEHQLYPFDKLVDELSLPRDMSRQPLFDIMIAYQSSTHQAGDEYLGSIDIESASNEVANSKFDITFFFDDSDEGIRYGLEYNTDLFSRSHIEQMANHLERILSAGLQNPGSSLSSLDYLLPEEKQQLLLGFNQTQALFPEMATLVDIFEEQVSLYPDNIAIAFEDKYLTYTQLNESANRLAHYLRNELKVLPEELVGILMDRSDHLLIGILAILKSGAAYLPVDPAHPEERINFVLNDGGVKVLITDQLIEDSSYTVFNPIANSDVLTGMPAYDPEKVNLPDHLCYVIYTSGSTGRPKGVMITHRNVVRLIINDKNPFAFSHTDSWTLFHSCAFDFSVWEIFGAWLTGAKLVALPLDTVQNVGRLVDVLVKEKVTVFCQIPSMFVRVINEVLSADEIPDLHIRYVIFGGEALNPSVLGEWKKTFPQTELINMYGITETTVHVTIKRITDEEIAHGVSNIGFPIPTLSLYLLDKNRSLVPIGIPGEIMVGGQGLSRGYWKREELTAQRFIDNPYQPGERLYCSGDVGRRLPNGEVIYMGRMDDQVKIRGYRIELGEIEQALLGHPSMIEVVVLAKQLNDDWYLVAYYTSAEIVSLDIFRQFLSKVLPDYMIPSYFIRMEAMPVSATGKIDRKALPEPVTGGRAKYIAPRTKLEEQLVEIWEEMLGKDRIGVMDNFFEIGGHSLKAIQLSSRIFKEYSVHLELKDIFAHPVLSDLAGFIQNSRREVFQHLAKVPEQEFYPLSHAQRRLWTLDQFEGIGAAYNIPLSLRIKGKLNQQALTDTMKTVVTRHESLRTVFRVVDGEVMQQVLPVESAPFEFEYKDLRNENADMAAQYVNECTQKQFDLKDGPLIVSQLIQLSEQEFVFTINMHHVVSDEWTMFVLIRELNQLYSAYEEGAQNPLNPLNPLVLQYKDYAAWQEKELEGEKLAHHQKFWMSQFQEELPILELPTDRLRPAIKSYNGDVILIEFNENICKKFETFCRQNDASPHIGLLTIVNTLLYKYTRQKDIILGFPVAGREHPDLEDLIGFFSNTLAIRTGIDPVLPFSQLMTTIRERVLEAYAHSIYPFDMLIADLNLNRDMSRSSLFDVMVLYRDTKGNTDEVQHEDGLVISDYDTSSSMSKFDITFSFVRRKEFIQLGVEYNTDLFDRERIVRMLSHIEGLMDAVATYPLMPLWQLPYANEAELPAMHLVTLPDEKAASSIIEMFEQQVAEAPYATALICEGRTYSFGELNDLANKLGIKLRDDLKVKPDQLVGLLMERNEWMLIGMLGILKAGGAYVPLDVSNPEDRISFVLNDSGVEILVTAKTEWSERFTCINPSQVIMDAETEVTNLPIVTQPGHLIYVLYTSGSTGLPKGAMIENRSVLNLFDGYRNRMQVTEADKMLAITTQAFDISVTELLLPLVYGAQVILASGTQANIPDALFSLMEKYEPTLMQGTPSFWNFLIENDMPAQPQLRVVAAGEALPLTLSHKVLDRVGQLWNMYGPTETTIYATYGRMLKTDSLITIGVPVDNTEVYIVDEYLQKVPLGIPGEMIIAGVGVARGYLNREALNKEKFIPDPFGTGLAYRTGDRVRWRSDGTIDFMGRMDNQIKLRGYRIELGEIEHTLRKQDNIHDAVVDVRQKGSEKYLVGYYTTLGDTDKELIRQALRKALPEYMVPTYLIQLEVFPMTSSGKIDRKKLPEPAEIIETNYQAPATVVEKEIALIWQEILDREQVGLNDNFFAIGGYSVKAIQIIMRINKKLNLKLPVNLLLEHPTIGEMAKMIAEKNIPAGTMIRFNGLAESKPNMYLFPTLVGTSMIYFPLVGFLQDSFNCFGLQDRGFETGDDADISLEEKASRFADDILRNQAEGEVLLTGFSFGAITAWETAKLLEKKGLKVTLICLDSQVRRKIIKNRKLEARNETDKKDIDLHDAEEQLKLLGFRGEQYEQMKSIWHSNIRLCDNYKQVGKINAPIVAFKAKGNTGRNFIDMKDWKGYTSGKFEHYYITGDHLDTISLPKNLEVIARHLQELVMPAVSLA